MDPAPPKVYPFPCTQCRARYFCHCATMEAAGWCWKCKALNCPCPKMTCKLCDVFEPICMECISLEKAVNAGYTECKKCESPYDCVCDLLIENGNCPTCLKLVCKCITLRDTPSDKIDTPTQ